MKITAILLGSSTIAASLLLVAQQAPPRTTTTRVHVSIGHLNRGEPAVSRDGGRFYFMRDSTVITMFDRATRQESRILPIKVDWLALSPAGDRLAFSRVGENGEGPHIWTLPLDARTGRGTGAPRRVSMTRGEVPSFSPDGNTIAFVSSTTDTANTLLSVPTAGGPERVIARGLRFVEPIQWTPDGRFIYFGMHWYEGSNVSNVTGMYRVSAEGGVPQMVIPTADYGAIPGLSPDGRTLIVWDRSWDSTIVANADGQRRASYLLRNDEGMGEVWFGSNSAMSVTSRTPGAINIASLSNGATRRLADSVFAPQLVLWSPDGKHIAYILGNRYGNAQSNKITIASADGRTRKTVQLPIRTGIQGPPTRVAWSPDSRSIALLSIGGAQIEFWLLDVATAKVRKVASLPQLVGARSYIRWRSDSRALLYARDARAATPDTALLTVVREVTTNGVDRAVASVRTSCGPAEPWCGIFMVSDTLFLSFPRPNASIAERVREYRVYNLRSPDGAGRLVNARNNATQTVPTLSANHAWMAIRDVAADQVSSRIEIISVATLAKKTITLPFPTAPGGFNPWVSDDGKVVVVGSAAADEESITYYRVDVATGNPTRLVTLPRMTAPHDIAISPDGRSVAFPLRENEMEVYEEHDLTALVNRTARQGGGERE